MNSQLSTLNPHPSVQLHIERLVVDEALLTGGRSGTLQTAIETELARLLVERGLIAHSDMATPSLTARNIQITHQTRPAQLGKQIAQAVHTTIAATNLPASNRQPNGGAR